MYFQILLVFLINKTDFKKIQFRHFYLNSKISCRLNTIIVLQCILHVRKMANNYLNLIRTNFNFTLIQNELIN